MIDTITSPAHTVTNTWETNRNILDTKENKAGTTIVSKYDYLVNAIGQRSNVAQSGTAFAGSRDIAWGYDPLGQVTSADSTIPGLDRAYQFDLIGNRLKTADSLTLPVANNYTPNLLNQYTTIDTLNPVHDDDGNMTAGPLPANVNANSTLIWDGENRLIQAQVPGGATVNFIYDSQSRRIAETVGTATKITVYDGWNPIAEYWRAGLQPASLAKSFTWGMDLSGTMQGAGGVGGLLAVTDSTGTYYPTYDGNGNVSEYLDSTGAVVAHYEYDPFGKITVATGAKAQDFSHRFSTKPLDITTGLYYYAYRYYDPMTGRWPSRDPIGERGGMNLYAFVKNMTITYIDVNGLKEYNSNSQNAQERNRQEKINIQTKHNGVSNRANKGAATLDEAASAAGNKATAAGSLPDEVIKWGNIISSEAQRREADEKCKKSAEIIFQFENHFFGPKKVCKLCCVYSGILNEAGWFYSTHRIVRGSCDDIRKDEYEKFENTDYIGDPADTVTIGFIDFTNPLK